MIYWAMFSCSKISDLARFETTLVNQGVNHPIDAGMESFWPGQAQLEEISDESKFV